ncbi:hypothetical protein [Candidatus Pantoea persica]|uniref:hypothetical protein n=1 Tax=Candidatus Pantoea persica TaxID=2518128 RepID=UPI00215D6D29|nr:hypothetical protein [Candidatus Pantoea persica]
MQDSTGAATSTYVVSSGNDDYAMSIDDATGAVSLNTTDATYDDTTNGVTDGAMGDT